MKIIIAAFVFSLTFFLGYSAEIDRATFSVSLPDQWIENTNDDMYNSNSCVFFEGPQSTFVFVMIGKKSAGASVDELVNSQKTAQAKRFQDAKVAEITKWSNYEGKGFKMEGKVMGIFDGQLTVLGFEKGDSVCLIEEYATRNDCKKFAEDFEKIRKTFKLK
jgi:hypothetical protein